MKLDLPAKPRTSQILFSILILRPTHSWNKSQEIAPFLKLMCWMTQLSPRCCPWRKDARISSKRGRVLGLYLLPAPRVVSGLRNSGLLDGKILSAFKSHSDW